MASKWYYRVGDDQHGPIESKALKLLAEVGQISPHTLVQKEGAKSWAEASRVKGLFDSDSLSAPPVIESAEEETVPTATEIPYKVAPAPQVPVAAAVEPNPHVIAPAVLTSDEKQESGREYLEYKRRRKSAMPLLFTMAGIMVVAGIGSFLIFTYEGSTSDQSPTPTNNTGLVSQSPSATPLEVSEEEQVFRTIRSFSDASNAKKRLPNGKIQIQITEVWITKSEKTVDGVSLSPEYSMNVLLETENLDNVNAVTVHRESAVASDTDSMNPYQPLARNGKHGVATLKTALQSLSIPAGGRITETLTFKLASDELDNFQIAIPLAWFRQSGYIGYNVPDVMVSGNSQASANIALQSPDVSAPENSETPEQAPGNAIVGQAASNPPSPTEDSPKPEAQVGPEGNGQLPPPPDFGIPNKPEGANGDQPENINSLQQSIKTSVQDEKDDQQEESAGPTEEPTVAPKPAEPVFK